MADLLGELVRTVDALKARIKEHGTELRRNETRTRTVLIDPLLNALGWDVADPSKVTIEFYPAPSDNNKRADYALLARDRRPLMLIEAKKLGEALDSHQDQVFTYANQAGAKYGCLTDGDAMEIYETFRSVPLHDRLEIKLSIESEDSAKCALKLMPLWLMSLQSDGRLDKVHELELASGGIASTSDSGGTGTAVVPPVPAAPAGWTPLSQVPKPTNQPAPKAISLPDGMRALTTWRGVLSETALWLIREGILTRKNCGAVRRGKHAIFSVNAVHPEGDSFKSPVPLEGTGIIMEAHLSAHEVIRLSMKILKHFNQNPSQVTLKLQ